MGAIHICVFVRHDIIDCASNVSTTYVACGIGNVMYNKGAVAVRMNFYDTSVAFICAHLAANKEKVIIFFFFLFACCLLVVIDLL